MEILMFAIIACLLPYIDSHILILACGHCPHAGQDWTFPALAKPQDDEGIYRNHQIHT